MAVAETTSNRPAARPDGYSPPLRIKLEMAGRSFNVAMTAPSWIIVRDVVEMPPGDGVLHVEIDGDVRSRVLTFPEGFRPDRRRQPCSLGPHLSA
ncbi:MAG: hypothetical protein AAF561_13590 [Planctomycetota bacterium]